MRYFVFTLFLFVVLSIAAIAQDQPETNSPLLAINILNTQCDLTLVQSEVDEIELDTTSTSEPDVDMTPIPTVEGADTSEGLPVLSLGEDCEAVTSRLRMASNGVLWLALSMPGEDEWQQFEPFEDDDYPPQFDRRGRYVGCVLPEMGEQVCRLLWEHDEVTYLVEIPVVVGNAFYPTAVPTIVPTATVSAATPTLEPSTFPGEPLPTDDLSTTATALPALTLTQPPTVPASTAVPTTVAPTTRNSERSSASSK